MNKIIINNLLITLIFFFIFEIFLRFFGLADLRGHGKELREKQKNVETVVFGKKVFLDKYGYRIPNEKYIYDKNKIIFIGDSVLFGSGVKYEDTFVGKLKKKYDNKSFINAAIIGNDISENSFDIKKNYELFNSNNFFIILTLDDIASKESQPSKNDIKKENRSLFAKLRENYLLNKINLFLRTKSYTYLWIKGITTKPSKRYFYESLESYKIDKEINFLNSKLNDIKIYQNNNNLNIKFIILPYEYQTRHHCKSKLMIPQEKILDLLEKNKLEYINLTEIFCNHPKPKILYLNFDPVHLSKNGHQLVYESIKDNFK